MHVCASVNGMADSNGVINTIGKSDKAHKVQAGLCYLASALAEFTLPIYVLW